MPEPILSIVTPSLNQADWLAECLESVAVEAKRANVGGGNGGGNGVEHIILDGGSADGSAAIIASHAERHPGLVTHWASEPDGGQSDAINKGCAIARGRFATWLNADDWYEPGGLLALVRAIDANPDADVIVGRCRFVNLEGETVWDPSPPMPMSAANFLKLRTHWFNAKMIVQPEAIFRLSAFREVGGLNVDNHYSMDHELWIELALAGARFVAVDAPVACLRVHSGQKSADNRSVVRSMLVTGERVVREHALAFGDKLGDVRDELDAVAGKLRVADALIARFDLARALKAGDGGREGGGGSSPQPVGGGSSADEGQARVERELRTLAQPHARKALKLAARQVGKRVRVCMHTSTPGALNVDLSRVFRKVTLVGEGEGVGDQASGNRKSREGGEQWGRADIAVLDNVLATEANPEGIIRSLWASLRPGGVMLVLNELIPAVGLMAYLDSLEVHLNNHLAANNDLVLHPEADAYLQAIVCGGGEDTRGEAHEGACIWLARLPSCLGVDITSIMAENFPDARVLMNRTHGSYWFHPIAPFPFVPTAGVAQQDTRLTGVWAKEVGSRD